MGKKDGYAKAGVQKEGVVVWKAKANTERVRLRESPELCGFLGLVLTLLEMPCKG